MSTMENVYVNSSNFSANAGKAFSQLWRSEDFSDVTLVTGDKRKIKAHKIVLFSSSNFFRDILTRNIHPNPLLYLKDTLHDQLELLLKFIYQGECEVKTEMLEQFLELGKHLEVRGLVQDQELETGTVVKENQTTISKEKAKIKKEEQINSSAKDTPVFSNSKQEGRDEIPDPPLNLPNNQMSCSFCSDEFSERRLLSMHQLNNHEGTWYNCDQCNYKATQHKNLILHKQSKHEGVEYLCGQCGFKGIDKASLGKHMGGYHRGKRYFCDHCDYRAKQGGNVKLHIEAKHKGKNYNCGHCDFQTAYKQELPRHIQKIHSINTTI